jgi:hypothetical protein
VGVEWGYSTAAVAVIMFHVGLHVLLLLLMLMLTHRPTQAVIHIQMNAE